MTTPTAIVTPIKTNECVFYSTIKVEGIVTHRVTDPNGNIYTSKVPTAIPLPLT